MSATEFRKRIRTALANETLQIALDANAERRVNGRVNALASLPNWKERRQRAHAVRAEVIEHLDEYLEKFIARAKANHVNVHRAANMEEANRIIIEIIESTRTKDQRDKQMLIAKSKSMVTEELDLNHALESAGMRVVETDLGEYIVQLRKERPAHIITPAVHLRRYDVGKLFHEKLGVPYTEDIPTLVNIAHKVLREVFLTADIGISGANFGIAETGGICLVTNEGNGRMVTTLPRTHIALLGLERIVPALDDLALMLSLLARSATGQKLSVYTQIIHQPLADQQRHILILDNGRTKLRNSPLKESLYCIRCGACLNACPVFREIGGHAYNSIYSGPIGSVISAGLFGSEFVPLAQPSSLCGACKDACPVDIDLPKLLTRVRAGLSPITNPKLPTAGDTGLSPISKLFLWIYSRIARSPRLFALSQKFAWLGTFLSSPFSGYVRLPAFTGWGYSKDLPGFAAKPFRSRWRNKYQVDTYTRTEVKGVGVDAQPDALPIPVSLVSLFTRELTAVSGQVIQTDKNNLTSTVIDFLKSRAIKRIHLEPNILDEAALSKVGITVSHDPDPAIRVGVTKAICGLADTGSILAADGAGSPLHASLLTEIHIAVLHISDILPSLEDALPLTRETKSAVFITGPSRTGDIEMSHTIGVHGPGEVIVILYA